MSSETLHVLEARWRIYIYGHIYALHIYIHIWWNEAFPFTSCLSPPSACAAEASRNISASPQALSASRGRIQTEITRDGSEACSPRQSCTSCVDHSVAASSKAPNILTRKSAHMPCTSSKVHCSKTSPRVWPKDQRTLYVQTREAGASSSI